MDCTISYTAGTVFAVLVSLLDYLSGKRVTGGQ